MFETSYSDSYGRRLRVCTMSTVGYPQRQLGSRSFNCGLLSGVCPVMWEEPLRIAAAGLYRPWQHIRVHHKHVVMCNCKRGSVQQSARSYLADDNHLHCRSSNRLLQSHDDTCNDGRVHRQSPTIKRTPYDKTPPPQYASAVAVTVLSDRLCGKKLCQRNN